MPFFLNKRFPFCQQRDAMDCGPTCLRMVAQYYKKDVSQEFLHEKAQIGKQGVNLLGISEAAEVIGFRTHAAKIPFSKLSDAIVPAILHWNQNHFVVLYRIKRNNYYIADPAVGLIQIDGGEFKYHWISDVSDKEEEGVALLLTPSSTFYQNSSKKKAEKQPSVLGSMLRYLRPHKKLIFQLLLGISAASILQLFLPVLTQSIVDEGIATANIHFVTVILFAQLALFAGRIAIEFVRGWILLHVSTQINVSIMADFLAKLLRLPVSFFDSKRTGDLLQRINDHSRIENFLTGASLNTFFSLINLAVFSVVIAFYNASIFLIFCAVSVVYSVWVTVFMKERKKLDYQRFDLASKEQSLTIHLLQGMQEIKLHGIEQQMRWGWQKIQARLFRLSMKILTVNQWQQSGGAFLNEGKNILITFVSAKAVIDGQMTLGSMLAVQYIIGQLNSPIEQLISFAQSWQNARISMSRLTEVHALEDEEPQHKKLKAELPPEFARKLVGGLSTPNCNDMSGHMPVTVATPERDCRGSASIHLRDVSFTYAGAGNQPVLHNINLEIPKGKMTAIVGTSGSGKTTLLKLLLKFYSPTQGVILLGETNLDDISHKVWRSYCGVVMQESYVFSDTIARNIAVGTEEIDPRRLVRAAHTANLHGFIASLPLGYNTMIGAEGTGISMGQKQRILIARAVYRNPEFIFLDEATNSLDAENERCILSNLSSFLRERTVVVVAHRLSTVKQADQIVVLNDGKITEKGTHRELVALSGVYFQLVKDQLELGY